ncbi:MAG TPA: hypothetical protein VE569_09695 [Acidimicrobiia bacterium]|nr:hypothetical protein [Acidimicrobiia bacterium]
MIRRFLVGLTLVSALIVLGPGVAWAHGIGGRLDLPVPASYFIIGAGVVLVLSFVALAVLWPEPRLQGGPEYLSPVGPRVPRGGPLSVVGVVALLLVTTQPMVASIADPDLDRPTIAPVTVWVLFWLVVPFLSVLLGDWYTDLNPWRALARWLRVGKTERTHLLERIGVWPAVGGFLCFAWLELVYPDSSSPVALGVAALAYTLGLFLVVAYAGRETGLAAADIFTPYNRLISSISPLGRGSHDRLVWRGWLRSLTVLPEWPGLAALVVVAIGTITFDGGSNTTFFRDTFADFGSSIPGATVLLVGSVALIGGGYALASWAAARLVGGGWTTRRVATRFTHTLVPIALAYAVAHYLTLVLFEGQQVIAAISDPFGLGWNLFGTADRNVDFFITTSQPIWYPQVGVIICGHVTGVVLAHDRALADFGPEAVRSQYAMLLLMVALTTLGLLILAG